MVLTADHEIPPPLSIIPLAAIAPILIFIGVVTANQVVRETPRIEVPVIFIAMFPWVTNWGLTLSSNGMRALGTNAGEVGFPALEATGTNYIGLYALGNGAPLTSLIWGSIAIFAIRNKTIPAMITALVGGALDPENPAAEGMPQNMFREEVGAAGTAATGTNCTKWLVAGQPDMPQ